AFEFFSLAQSSNLLSIYFSFALEKAQLLLQFLVLLRQSLNLLTLLKFFLLQFAYFGILQVCLGLYLLPLSGLLLLSLLLWHLLYKDDVFKFIIHIGFNDLHIAIVIIRFRDNFK